MSKVDVSIMLAWYLLPTLDSQNSPEAPGTGTPALSRSKVDGRVPHTHIVNLRIVSEPCIIGVPRRQLSRCKVHPQGLQVVVAPIHLL